jgi:HTH-type transcriptional regulator / antitoxin HipB
MPVASPPLAIPLALSQQLHELLRTARRSRKLTQKDLAGRLGLSQGYLSHLESHPGELSVDQLLAWTAAVGLTVAVGHRAPPATPPADVAW